MTIISFKLNDFQYTINNKLTLIQACLKNKVDVPRFCFHEKLAIAGNCRMCLVEDLKQVKPLASCAINVSNGMSIYTNTVKVKKARESVLEFLLANHPLDCPICDQGGECDLQDQSLVFGSDRGRFYEFKRSVEDKDCGPLIKTVMNRCIHCTRCVRFSNEVAGVNVLGVTGRGSKMEIGFYIENLMRSELSGNVIDLCPVGALTSKPFSFTSRPWELKSYNSIDIFDTMHSSIRVDVRGTKIMRILPRVNEDINEDWITDRVRFSYDAFRRQRLFEPMVVVDKTFIKIGWRGAFFLLKNHFFNFLKYSKSGFLPIKPYFSNFLDLEALYMFKKLINISGNSAFSSHLDSGLDNRLFYSFNTKLSSISEADLCLLLGLNLRIAAPLLNAKIRQAYIKKSLPIYVIGYFSNFTYYCKHVSTNYKSVLQILEGSHWLSSKFSKISSKKPLFLVATQNAPVFHHFLSLSYTNLISDGWVGVNCITNDSFSSKEIALNSKQSTLSSNYSINYLVNYDEPDVKGSGFNIYQGHHGDYSASIANLIFPSTSFIEKSSLYLNFSGILQKTKKVLFSVGNSRDDWKIFNALIQVMGFPFNLKNSFELISLISKSTPFILYKKPSNLNIKVGKVDQQTINFKIGSIKSTTNNFYLSSSILRNSKIMSLCHNRFKTKNYNFS